jgi:hypothetical protein
MNSTANYVAPECIEHGSFVTRTLGAVSGNSHESTGGTQTLNMKNTSSENGTTSFTNDG